MRKTWVLAAILLAGCQPPSQAQVEAKAAETFDSVKSSLNVATAKVMDQVGSVTARSSMDALENAKQAALKLKDQVAGADLTQAAKRVNLAQIQTQLDRLQAAIDVQKLKAEWEQIRFKAVLASIYLKNMDTATQRAKLRETNPTFKEVDDRLIAAQRTYETYANQAAEALKNK